MAYYIKTCGKLRSLSNYSNRDAVYKKCGDKTMLLLDKIKAQNNSFIDKLCAFLGDDHELKDLIYKNFKMNANDHLESFFDKSFFEQNKFSVEIIHKKTLVNKN